MFTINSYTLQHADLLLTKGGQQLKKEWRIPEKHLFLCGILGGAIGGFYAMLVLPHKTSVRKREFCVIYTVLFVLNVLVVLVVAVHSALYLIAKYSISP